MSDKVISAMFKLAEALGEDARIRYIGSDAQEPYYVHDGSHTIAAGSSPSDSASRAIVVLSQRADARSSQLAHEASKYAAAARAAKEARDAERDAGAPE